MGAGPGPVPAIADAEAQAVDVVVERGDVLYLPLGWWHAVSAATDGRHLSVNHWFSPPPGKADGDALLALL